MSQQSHNGIQQPLFAPATAQGGQDADLGDIFVDYFIHEYDDPAGSTNSFNNAVNTVVSAQPLSNTQQQQQMQQFQHLQQVQQQQPQQQQQQQQFQQQQQQSGGINGTVGGIVSTSTVTGYGGTVAAASNPAPVGGGGDMKFALPTGRGIRTAWHNMGPMPTMSAAAAHNMRVNQLQQQQQQQQVGGINNGLQSNMQPQQQQQQQQQQQTNMQQVGGINNGVQSNMQQQQQTTMQQPQLHQPNMQLQHQQHQPQQQLQQQPQGGLPQSMDGPAAKRAKMSHHPGGQLVATQQQQQQPPMEQRTTMISAPVARGGSALSARLGISFMGGQISMPQRGGGNNDNQSSQQNAPPPSADAISSSSMSSGQVGGQQQQVQQHQHQQQVQHQQQLQSGVAVQQPAPAQPAAISSSGITLPVGVGIRLGGITDALQRQQQQQGGMIAGGQQQQQPWGAAVGGLGGILGGMGNPGEVPEQVIAERRQRNREHAKRSRVRKKFLLESLQEQVRDLQRENTELRMVVQERIPDKAQDIISECCQASPLFDDDVLKAMKEEKGGGKKRQQAANGGAGSSKGSDDDDDKVAPLVDADFTLVKSLTSSQQIFVLSDPRLPDNPIVFASGGFYEMTGYTREEVLGRNCRFLQGPGTDPRSVDIIRKAVSAGTECTTCILNYKADGTPFWNQFFVAALRDSENCIVNYIGVQCPVEPDTGSTALEAKVNAVLPLQVKDEKDGESG